MTFGTLTAAYPGRAAIRYALTPPDVGAIARFIVGTGADRDSSRRRELVWRLLERFASVADRYPSLRDFVVQRLPSLPRITWNELPAVARDVAIAAASGRFGRSPSGAVSVEPAGAWQPSTVTSYPSGYAAPVYAPPVYGRGYPAWRYPIATVRDHRHPVYRRGYTPSRREMEMETTPPPDANANAQPDERAVTPPPPPPRRRRHATNGNGTSPPVEQPPAPIAATPDPNLAQMAAPLPPSDDAGDFADDAGDDALADDSTAFTTLDGNQLTMSPRFLRGFVRRRRRRRQQHFPMSSGFNRSLFRGRPLASRLGRLVQRTRRIGTLRHRSTGRRFPVFGGRVGSRNFHIVARRRGTQFEIMGVRSEALEPQSITSVR